MLRVAAIFKDGMILQRNSKVAVFGETDCDRVEAKLLETDGTDENIISESSMLLVNAGSSHFQLILNTNETRKLCKLIIKGYQDDKQDIIEINDILLGEVWLDGGQSNMELELQNSMNGKNAVDEADYGEIRFYKVPKYPTVDEGLLECEKGTAWRRLKGAQCADMSAVAYYFATKLYETLKVPIGIIDCYQGGTSATCWVSEEGLSDIPEVAGYIKEWEDEINAKSDEQYAKEMDEYNASLERWQRTVDELKAKDPNIEAVDINSIAGPYPWPLPRGKSSAFRPHGLHKSMLSRVAPYTVRGFIYYQAEEDCDRADYYCKLNSAVIKQWRKDFSLSEDDEIKPFFITQLPMFISAGADDDKKWCVLRQQQYMCSQTNEKVGMAVIADCGEYDNIHPLDKKTPGHRLAGRVLADVYENTDGLHNFTVKRIVTGNDKNLNNCMMNLSTNECLIEFDGSCKGICYRDSDGQHLTAWGENIILSDGDVAADTIYGFEISNNGTDFYKPQIRINKECLILSGKEGLPIKDVRYGWFNYGVVNLYSRAGVPLMPFWIRDIN